MNKFGLAILIAMAFVLYSQQIKALDPQKMLEIASECKVQEKATEMDFASLKTNVKSKTKTMKCLVACFFEKSGKIKNKKIDAEGVLKDIKSSPKMTENLLKSMKELINECNTIKDSDRCEYASKILDCFIEGAAKRGIQSETVN